MMCFIYVAFTWCLHATLVDMLLFFVMCVFSTALCFSINVNGDESYNILNISNDINNISAVPDVEKNQRKYGLSLNDGCKEYIKVFKCMTNCMALNFQIYRLNFKCECTCHKKKSIYSTLPYFQWKTTGTTKKVPKTRSPYLWSIVGTLAPTPTVLSTSNATEFTCPPIPTTENTTLPGNNISENGLETTVVGDVLANDTTIAVAIGPAADGLTTKAVAATTGVPTEAATTLEPADG